MKGKLPSTRMKPRFVRLEDVCDLVSKGSTPTSMGFTYSKTGIPFLRAEDILGGPVATSAVACRITPEVHASLTRSQLKPGDLLVTIAGTLGRVGYVPLAATEINCNQAVAFARLRPKLIDVNYACYACQAPTVLGPFLALQKVGTIGNLNLEQLRDLRLPLPPLPTQRRIAAQLDEADRLRRTRRYALDLVDSFLPASFLQFFGDPADNPRDFDRVQVEELFSENRDGAKCGPFGSALKKREYVQSGIPVWTMDCVGQNEFHEANCLFISEQKFDELRAYDAQNGDILVSRAGTVGRMAIVRTSHPRSIIHSNIIRLSLNPKRILPIYFVVLMTFFADRVARLKRGQEDAYTFMSTGTLGELRIPLPPITLQEHFAELAGRTEDLRSAQREALRQAEHLFGSLLHDSFSGLDKTSP